MGTRNLTMVVKDGKTVVGQYGQWDGYPEGQGKTALTFLALADLDKFKEQLNKCKFVDGEKETEIKAFLTSIGCADGWMTQEQATKFDAKYPYFSRDHGAEILGLIQNSTDEVILLQNRESFAANSLFCEWAYVIDLDKNTFEVYMGFNEEPLAENERFFPQQRNPEDEAAKEESEGVSTKYSPVKLFKSYSLSDLPTQEDFLKDCEPQGEEKNI